MCRLLDHKESMQLNKCRCAAECCFHLVKLYKTLYDIEVEDDDLTMIMDCVVKAYEMDDPAKVLKGLPQKKKKQIVDLIVTLRQFQLEV